MLEPCSTAATPPTTTNSMPASLRRCNRLGKSLTQLHARPLRLQHQRQGGLVLKQPPLGREPEGLVDEAQVESGFFRLLVEGHLVKIHRQISRSMKKAPAVSRRGLLIDQWSGKPKLTCPYRPCHPYRHRRRGRDRPLPSACRQSSLPW